MSVQKSNSYIQQLLPVTITPVLHHNGSGRPVPPLAPLTQKPDLTFHCICCKAYFVNPFLLYQHMNVIHADLPEPSASKEDDEENTDYSWVFEPVCELVAPDDDESNAAVTSQDSSDSDESGSDNETQDDDDEDDDDDDDDDSSSSTSSSSSSSSSSTSSNSNSNSQPANGNLAGQNGEVMPEAAYEEVEVNSMLIATNSSSNSNSYLGINGTAQFPQEYKLKVADPRESTSIILLNNAVSNGLTITPVLPINNNMNPNYANTNVNILPTSAMMIEPIKRRRGRRSMAAQVSVLTSTDQKCFQCTHCEASFPTAGDLSKHVRSHISNKPFQCSICQKKFTHIGSLNTHIRIHSGEKPYKCEMCAKAFTQSSSLSVHIRSHSIRKPYQCDKCDKGFINYSSLVMHQKTHTESESFVCPECEKEFKCESMLDEHMRMHTQELVYQCSICRQGFRTSSELVQHMKCHIGEKPFTCSICDRSFTQSGSLNIHMRIHTGEKPFHCKLCDKSFTQASSLSVHMKIHSGEKPFPCPICGKSYSQQAYLNKHIQSHAAEQLQLRAVKPIAQAPSAQQLEGETLVCIVCGALHRDADSLALHVTQQHAALLHNMQQAEFAAATATSIANNPLTVEQRQQAYMQRVQAMVQQMQQQERQQTMALALTNGGTGGSVCSNELELNSQNSEVLVQAGSSRSRSSADEDDEHAAFAAQYEIKNELVDELEEELNTSFLDENIAADMEIYDDNYAAEEEVCTELDDSF